MGNLRVENKTMQSPCYPKSNIGGLKQYVDYPNHGYF